MNVLVAGGAGTVGVRLADALIDAGNRVVVYDDMSAPHAADGARWLDRRRNSTGRLSFVFRDVRDGSELDRAIGAADAVIHAAAPLCGAGDALELGVRVHGTLELLGVIERRAPAAHLVLLSDSGVYGNPVMVRGNTAMFAAREAQILTPMSSAAAAAACAEQYIFAAARSGSRRATVIRLPVVYATDPLYAMSDAFPARLACAARTGSPLASNADPRWPYDLVHIDDVTNAVLRVLARPEGSVGEAFNVGGGARFAPSVWDMTQHLAEIGGRARLLPPLGETKPSPVLDVTRITRVLGWEPAITWKEGLARLFAVATPPANLGTTNEATAQALVAWPRAEGLA